MAKKFQCLDLFCGGGGAARGLIAAGFEVVGIDIKDHRKRYPGVFIQGDALNPPVRIEGFDFVWASPPCQLFSRASGWSKVRRQRTKVNLIPQTRALLEDHSFTVIENVPDAPIRSDIVLTGPMFGLDRILRRRHFEISFRPPMHAPIYQWACEHVWQRCSITQHMSANPMFRNRKAAGLPGRLPVTEARAVMGIDAPLTCAEVGEAVPPAYAEFIGRAAMNQLASRETH